MHNIMDLSDACNIEFLDLSDVDESEQIRVRTSLQHNDPSVQLPWLKPEKKKSIQNKESYKKPPVVQTDLQIPPPVSHNDYIHSMVSPPLVNNIYPSQPHVVVPQIMHPGYVLQSNVVCYTSPPIQSTYPQQIFIPPNAVHNFSHTATYYPITPNQPKQSAAATLPVQQETLQHNGTVHSPPLQNGPSQYAADDVDQIKADQPEEHRNVLVNQHAHIPNLDMNKPIIQNSVASNEEHVFNQNSLMITTPNIIPAPSTQNTVPVPSSKPPVNEGITNVMPQDSVSQSISPNAPVSQSTLSSTVTQNGHKTSPTPAPASKSWASLFSSKPSNGVTAPVAKGANVSAEPVSNQTNNAPICPIKHPRKSAQFVDPDCYRMGEFLNSYTVDGRTISLQPRGLLNQSNYCYINSILQALIACPPLYNLLSSLSQNISSNEKRKPTPVIDGMCRFVREFKHLPANLRVNNRRCDGKIVKKDVMVNTDIPFEPSWIYKMLNGIRTDLIEGRQEDAEEFLGCLLNGLNDEMLELINLVKSDSEESSVKDTDSEDKEWQVMGPKNKGSVTRRTDFGRTPISDIFGGLLKSRIHRTGDHITENIQPFFTLQLNIEKVKTVREALEALVTKYQLEGLTSSKTNEEVEAWQQVMLDELPVVLILHLKCFDFKLDGCTKIVKALEFPIDLKIEGKLLSSKTQSAKEKQYKLFAVVYHDGKEASKGHYITDAFHVGYSCWLRYDDASVKTVQEEHVLKPQGTRVPYLLFYRRCDTIKSK